MIWKMIRWIQSAIFVGILPLVLHLLICLISKNTVAVILLCSEFFYLDIAILMDSLISLKAVKCIPMNEDYLEVFIMSSIFLIIISSVMYGLIIYNTYERVIYEEGIIFAISIIITFACVINGFFVNYIKIKEG